MLRRLFDLIGLPLNQTRMGLWTKRVEQIVRQPPGSDSEFSEESIARFAKTDFSRMSTWAIVCEEVLDTVFPVVYFQRARDELRRRGITDAEYQAMRRFAWLTAGWLNFEMMLWDWCSLNERDIQHAIQWQFSDGWISETERDRMIKFADRYSEVDGEG